MKNFHGVNKWHSFFEGWYLKHQNEEGKIIIFIPSYHLDNYGSGYGAIQVITQENSHYLRFSVTDARFKKRRFWVKIGDNIFSDKGLSVNIDTDELKIRGSLRYSYLTPLKYDIMGPFCFFPFMQCNHGVLSLNHYLKGKLKINGEILDFKGGAGYIEKDWGSSFPASYLWTQCNWFDGQDNCLMLSIAEIPFLIRKFIGCICVIYYGGKEYRLTTYLGVKIIRVSANEVIIKQRNLSLQIQLLEYHIKKLKAPVRGGMGRIVHESPICKVRYKFMCKDKIIFNFISEKASYEYNW